MAETADTAPSAGAQAVEVYVGPGLVRRTRRVADLSQRDLVLVPPGLHLSVEGHIARRRAAQQRIPNIRYERSMWRSLPRLYNGIPDDHPTWAELVAAVEARYEVAH